MQVKEAVEIAKDYVTDLFGADGTIAGVRLEEVDRGAQGVWNVTIGFSRPLVEAGEWSSNFGAPPALGPRNYRVVTIDDKTGEVISVKIRFSRD